MPEPQQFEIQDGRMDLVATEYVQEDRMHYSVVVLRQDQLDRIADAVVRKLREDDRA